MTYRAAALTVLLALTCVTTAAPATAQMFGPEYQACRERAPRDPEMIACLMAQRRQWDGRMAKALTELPARVDKDQRRPLIAAQKDWARYRDANCLFYASRDGSIRSIQEAECRRAMTEGRAIELERAMVDE